MVARRRTARRSPSRTVTKTAQIGRFDSALATVGFVDGDTVQVLVDKAGLTLASSDTINNESGDDISLTDKAKNGEKYFVCQNYKQGNN